MRLYEIFLCRLACGLDCHSGWMWSFSVMRSFFSCQAARVHQRFWHMRSMHGNILKHRCLCFVTLCCQQMPTALIDGHNTCLCQESLLLGGAFVVRNAVFFFGALTSVCFRSGDKTTLHFAWCAYLWLCGWTPVVLILARFSDATCTFRPFRVWCAEAKLHFLLEKTWFVVLGGEQWALKGFQYEKHDPSLFSFQLHGLCFESLISNSRSMMWSFTWMLTS